MALDDNKTTERQRDAATIELLKKLREKLLSDNISNARQGAFNLSWKQEDGLAILKEVLFGNYPRTAKKAAAYGLRSMKGRMHKLAVEVHEQGLKHSNRTTQAVCIKSISIMKGEVPKASGAGEKTRSGRRNIRGIRINNANGMRKLPENRPNIKN
jgi:hypothetical protein